jgi:hypothetical protein
MRSRRPAVIAPDPLHRDLDLARLEKLIRACEPSTDSFSELLTEHLKSARECLVAAMPLEYVVALGNAKQAATWLADSNLQKHMKDGIAELLKEIPGRAAPR